MKRVVILHLSNVTREFTRGQDSTRCVQSDIWADGWTAVEQAAELDLVSTVDQLTASPMCAHHTR